MKIIVSLCVIFLFTFSPLPAQAQTSSDQTVQSLLDQIKNLTAIVLQLQQQLANLSSPVQNSMFSKDLSVGQTDSQIKLLQRVLNNNGIIVSESGAGSPGSETDYFGPRTKDAVVRFQQKYAVDILAPQGLVTATGMVDLHTRKVLNRLLGNKAEFSDAGVATDAPTIISISPKTGKNGSTVTIVGKNFDQIDNQIQTSFGVYRSGSTDGKTLSFPLYSEVFAEINISDEDLEVEFGGDDSTEDVPEPATAESNVTPQSFPVPITVLNNSGTSETVLFYVQP